MSGLMLAACIWIFRESGARRSAAICTDPACSGRCTGSRTCQGRNSIAWQDEDGLPHAVRSEEVNAALVEICGEGTTAKTFRTWNGTVAAFAVAVQEGPLRIADMAEAAAERLHNTPAIARTSYIHPRVIALAELSEAERIARLEKLRALELSRLRAHEGHLVAFLETTGPAAA